MRLYLVRHAEAKAKKEDPERPLSGKGLADIVKVAAYLSSHTDIKVSSILHSGKARARQTAEALANRLKPPRGFEQADGLEPLADASIWQGRLKGVAEDIMLVGHIPHLSKLASRLLCGNEGNKIVDFSMAAVVCLEKGEWEGWAVYWMVNPEILS